MVAHEHYGLVSLRLTMTTCPKGEGHNSVHRFKAEIPQVTPNLRVKFEATCLCCVGWGISTLLSFDTPTKMRIDPRLSGVTAEEEAGFVWYWVRLSAGLDLVILCQISSSHSLAPYRYYSPYIDRRGQNVGKLGKAWKSLEKLDIG